jgi:CHAT domain-containing protein/tetratricopeptide (TPR) repeat protein
MAIILTIALFLLPPLMRIPDEVDKGDLARRYEQAFRAGESRWKEGNFQGAGQLLETALELAQATGDAGNGVKCRLLLGRLCWALGRMEDSEKYYSEALAGASRAGLPKEAEESRLALDLGKLYSRGQTELFAGQHERSVATFQAALGLAEKIGSREHRLKCLRQLSLVYWSQTDLDRFFSVNMRSLEVAQKLNDREEKFKATSSIGFYYLKLNDYSKALDFYSDALDAARAAQHKRDESLCLQNIGLILSQLGFQERSFDYLLEAYEIERQSENPTFLPQNIINMGVSFRNKWLALSDKRDLLDALSYFAEALDWGRRSGNESTELKALNNIGVIQLYLEKYHAAQRSFDLSQQLAVEIKEPEAAIEVLNNLGICHLQTGNTETALALFKAALEQGKAIGKDKALWDTLFFLGRCYERKEDSEHALESYRESLDAIENIRGRIMSDYYKVGFMKDKFKVYEAVIDHLWGRGEGRGSPGRLEEIFHTVERAKARAFVETLGEDKGDFRGRLNPLLEKEERDISNRISAAVQELEQPDISSGRREELRMALKQGEEEYLRLISRIRTEEPDLANAAFPLPLRVDEAQERLLDEKTAILEYFLGEKTSLLFLITQKSRDVFPLPPKSEIDSSLDAFLKLLSTPPEEEWSGGAAGGRLSEKLLSPALNALPPSIDRLIVIPDGPLWHLPFDALDLLPEDPSAKGSFLLSKYAVSYAPSCSALSFLRERKRKEAKAPALLAFGDPLPPRKKDSGGKDRISIANILRETYEGQGFDFSSLPQSGHEIKEISRYFSKKLRTICLRREASEARIKSLSLENYSIIHFACHGFVDEKIPYRSSLVLSPDEPSREDGFLQVREIGRLRLAAELVVLSACETGSGRVEQGEGILGLSRSFFYSGARAVVSTLWKIGDKATTCFMRYFYCYLSQGEDKAQALRKAKLRLLKSKYSHPFYWAPFGLHGEPFSRLDLRGTGTGVLGN